MRGGELVFNMGPEPNEKWASDPSNCPVTTIDRSSFIDAPFVKTGSRTFEESTQVELACLDTTVIIKYQVITQSSLGTSNFRTYNEPITLRNDRMIRFYGERDSLQTPVMEALFTKLSPNRRIELFSDYAPQYTAGGPAALIDKIRGARNFRTGAWQGYEGIDVIAEIDLGFNQTIHRLALSCFQNQDFWIFMPARVIYECSANGEDWEVLGSVENQIEEDLTGAFIQEFLIDVWKTARYIRVTAKSRGLCPVWHKGAGGKAWIFVDELLIE